MSMVETYEIYKANKADKDMRNAFKRSINFIEVCELIEKVEALKASIDRMGDRYDECTFNILRKKCNSCACFRNT